MLSLQSLITEKMLTFWLWFVIGYFLILLWCSFHKFGHLIFDLLLFLYYLAHFFVLQSIISALPSLLFLVALRLFSMGIITLLLVEIHTPMLFKYIVMVLMSKRELLQKSFQTHYFLHIFQCYLFILYLVHISTSFYPALNHQNTLFYIFFLNQPPY